MRFVLGSRYRLTLDFELASDSDALCICGHERDLHEHLRRGSDCGSCGRDICRAFARTQRTNVIPLQRRQSRPAAVAAKAG